MKKILISLFIIAVFAPFAAKAQEYTLLEPLPCIEGTSASGQKCSGGVTPTINFNDYVGYVFKFSIALAVFLAIIMIIWGGIQYMTSEVPFLKVEGKNKIGGALSGLAMVLASYLILATIDPRLVDIQTSVPQIKIARTSLVTFNESVSEDIRKLSLETQAKTNTLVAEKKALQQELDEVNKNLNERQQDLGAEEEEELLTKKAQLEQKIRGTTVEISKSTATAIGQSAFSRALDEIKNTAGNDDPAVRESNIALTKENLKVQYDAKINAILKNSTKPEAEKLAETYDLYNQKDFYLAQIDAEVELSKDIQLRKNIGTPSGPGYVQLKAMLDDNTKKLTEQLAMSQASLNDPSGPQEAGISTQEYKLIMQARIDEISKTLGTASPAQPTP